MLYILFCRPKYSKLSSGDPLANNRLAFSLLYKHYNIQQLVKPSEMARPDRLALFTYLSTVYEAFQNVDLPEKKEDSVVETQPSSAASPVVTVTAAATPPVNRKMTRRLSKKKSNNALKASTPTESWNTQTSSLRRSLSPRKQSKKEKKKSPEPELSPLHKSIKKPEEATPVATPTTPVKETNVKKEPNGNVGVAAVQPRKVIISY